MASKGNNKLDHYARVVIFVFFALYLYLSICCFFHERMGWFVVSIFILPIFSVAWAIKRFKASAGKSFVELLLSCAAIHLILWFAYTFIEKPDKYGILLEVAFYLCTAAGIFVIGFVLWVAYCILDEKKVNFTKSIGEHRFLTLMLFLGLFLYFTFFLTFALAFHDMGVKGPGLELSTRSFTKPDTQTQSPQAGG